MDELTVGNNDITARARHTQHWMEILIVFFAATVADVAVIQYCACIGIGQSENLSWAIVWILGSENDMLTRITIRNQGTRYSEPNPRKLYFHPGFQGQSFTVVKRDSIMVRVTVIGNTVIFPESGRNTPSPDPDSIRIVLVNK